MKYFLNQGVGLTLLSCEEKNLRYAELGAQVIITATRWRKFSKRRAWAVLYSMIVFPLFCVGALIQHWRKIRGIDVVYSYETISVMSGRLMGWLLSVPLVNRFQGTILSDLMRHSRFSPARLKRLDHFAALSCPAKLVVMTDDGTSGDKILRALNPRQHFLFLRNGFKFELQETSIEVSNLRQMLEIPDNDRIFMTLSRLVGWKRVDRAILAFHRYHSLNPGIRLVIVGDGDARASLEQMVSRLGMESKVVFLGMVPHEQVAGLIKQCDVFLSLFDLSNLGNPLFEAMLNARPIITLANGETRSVINDRITGYFSESGDPERVAEVMKWVVENFEAAALVGKNAKDWANRNLTSWSKRLEIEFDAIKKICTCSKSN